MSLQRHLLPLLAAALILGGLAMLIGRRSAADATEADRGDAAPTATVTTAVIRSAPVKDVIEAYGVVQAGPAASLTVAAPRAVIVTRALVQPGQAVQAGQALLTIADAPAAALAYRQASDQLDFARQDLARVQRLYDQRLAAGDQLDNARKALADAEAAVDAQRAQGEGRTTVVAPQAGVVSSLAVSAGDHAAQDAPLLTLARRNALSAKLSLQPSPGQAAVGEAVTLQPAAGGPQINTRLSLVGAVTDPASHALDAIAPLEGANLPIGSAVKGEIAVSAHEGLLAPRAAVILDETGAHVFVVQGAAARRVFVTVGPDQGDEVEISGPVSAGQTVAVQGAYELEDGMAVKVAAR
ncbi:MAG: efflux RND transporter periplasmic adaptor subunit [Caulobacteraceae bacterium]|nr:efflux RND transporter periplasmic adaptor subunit [Caulobacteraceae bacterium]